MKICLLLRIPYLAVRRIVKNQLDTKLINNEKDFLELQWVS
jgi:hypothetical protein